MKPLRPKYGQTAIYIALLAGVLAVMAFAGKCGRGNALTAVRQGSSGTDTIDVAIIYGPTSYYLYGDTLGGINYDMLRAFAGSYGKVLKFWPVVNLNDALSRLENHTYDMLASLPADKSVKDRFLTTRSVFLDRMVLVQNSDSSGNVKIKSALDLPGNTIHIQKGSPAIQRINNLSSEIGEKLEIVEEEGLSEEYLCMMVATSKMPLAVVNEKVAARMQKQYPRLSFENPMSFTQFQVWLTARGDTALQQAADTWLEKFQSTPEYRTLTTKY